MLNNNHIKIIDILLFENISTKKLSHHVNISERTLSNYINQINESLSDKLSIVKNHGSYSAVVFDEKGLRDELKILRDEIGEDEGEADKRISNAFQVLINNSVSTIDELADELFLSKSVINNILNEIKEIAGKYNVVIEGRPNVGLFVKGSEYKIRKVLTENFYIQYENMKIPEFILENLEKLKDQYKLDDEAYSRVKSSIKVILDRLNNGNLIEEHLNIDDQVFQSNDYHNFEWLISYINRMYDVENPGYEILLVVLQLFGRRASVIDEILEEDDDSLIQKIIDETIQDINDIFSIKINENLFNKDIRLHLKYLINRLLFDVKINNESVGDVQQKFPFAYELSKVLANNIEEETEVTVPVNELDFLSIYFSIFLDELDQKLRDIQSVAIITNQGLSTSKVIKMNLQQILKADVQISVLTPKEIDEESIQLFDLIISTRQTNRMFNKVIYIEDILDKQLLQLKIEQFLIYKDVNNIKLFNQSILFDTLSEKDIYHFKSKDNYFDIIEYLSKELVEEERVHPAFTEQVIQKETDKVNINNTLGFPHTSHSGEGIQIKLAIINESLTDYEDVKLIILMAIPEKDLNEGILIRLYEEILTLANSNYLMKQINQNTGFRELAYLLNQEMRKS